MSAKSMELSLANHLEYSLSKDQYTATTRDLFHSLALAVRDRMVERWIHTQQRYYEEDVRRVYYLSAEYLMGRALLNNLINLDLLEETRKALEDLSLNFEELLEQEPDAGLGNGGLGRLAACFLDSMATMGYPAYGYGIRYEFGIFEQAISPAGQVELPDEWLKFGNPWEIARPERNYVVRFYGNVTEGVDHDGHLVAMWRDTADVIGIAYDTPIDGYGNSTVNTLRLWSARASKAFDLQYFQHGDYLKAVEEKNLSENISKVLYPSDNIFQGAELRLKQQYFFVSCSIQDIIRRYLVNHATFDEFPAKVAIQLNDTHPSLAIVELLRLLIDEHRMGWEEAWAITSKVFAYTNHTILAEALEHWPVGMFARLLPRHMAIIHEINRRFLVDVAIAHPGDVGRLRRMSLIDEEGGKKVRMANLAIVGSRRVNGVSRLHTDLLKGGIFRDFADTFPERFVNITNGVTPRRWLLAANPGLAALLSRRIGSRWHTRLEELRNLEPLAGDEEFRGEVLAVKRANKERLAALATRLTGVEVDPASIFDVQVKRIHEYKRQLLNLLQIVASWLDLKENPGREYHPRTFIFGGKAAPSYQAAKLIIRLICQVAEMINRDPATRDLIKVVFLPNYRVYLAERIVPAADVSEQISTAGYEASGTSVMKFAMNGALTVGTLDGANIELMEEVGAENFFSFGQTVDQVAALRPVYDPRAVAASDGILGETLELIRRGFFSPGDPLLFAGFIDDLLARDPYFVLADFAAYRACQAAVESGYRDRDGWGRKAVLNIARCGLFSSDRTIGEYNRLIWGVDPVAITRPPGPEA